MGRISAIFAHHPSLKMYLPSLIWLQYFRLSFSALLTCFKECIVSDGADLYQHVLQSKREEVQEVMTLSGNTTRRSEESILWSPSRRLPTRRWRHTNRKRQEEIDTIWYDLSLPPTTSANNNESSIKHLVHFCALQSRLAVPWWLQQEWMLLLLDNGHQMSIMSIEFLEKRQHTFPTTATVMKEYKLWLSKFS